MPKNSFFQELKRRSVYRVAIAYIGVAWLLLQVISVVLPLLEAPAWVAKAILVLLVVGLPVALVFAWAYELSPQGIVRTTSAAARGSPYPDAKKKPVTSNWIIGLLVLIIAGQFFYNRWSTGIAKAAVAEKSIAVLPFRMIGNDENGRYFADGLRDVLISDLNKIEDLRVRSGTSADRFADPNEPIQTIAEQLNVRYLVEGSAQKHADDIRIVIKLIDPATDEHLWEGRYDRKYADIFRVQSEIAIKITEALGLLLSSTEKSEIAALPTQSKEAWDAYQKGRYYHKQFWKFSKQSDIDFALDFYDKSLSFDPDFPEALSYKASALGNANWITLAEDTLLQDRILELAQRAITLDPTLDIPHSVLGNFYYWTRRESVVAFDHYRRAIRLGPVNQDNYAPLVRTFQLEAQQGKDKRHYLDSALIYARRALDQEPGESLSFLLGNISHAYMSYGDFERAWAFAEAALAVEPDMLTALNHEFYIRLFQSNYARALEIARRSNEIRPDNEGLNNLGKAYLMLENYAEAEKYYTAYYTLPPLVHSNGTHERTAYAYALRQNGKEKQALEQLEIARQWIEDRLNAQPYDMAKVYAFRGETDRALNYLERFDPWFGLHVWIDKDPLFDSIREEPRFRAIVARCKVWGERMQQQLADRMAAGVFPTVDQLHRHY